MQTIAQKLREEGKHEGIKIGEKRGEKRGKEYNAKETAIRMLADGMSIETIAKYTGLNIEDIKKLRDTHQ